ncbi:MAG: VOC family protein [Bacteroidetes bacterium]|nr:VOC family protein [Bacteroidota bacterium]
MALNTYLNFNGNCAEAFAQYKEIFGGEYTTFMTFGDVPGDQPVSEADKGKIMHVSLPIGTGHLMGSDMPGYLPKATIGDNFSLSYGAPSQAEADRIFAALSAGGKVTMPMQKTFWSPWFGMLTDRYGIQWMIAAEGPAE